VLIISSELEELIGMCDRILVMSRGEIYGEFTRDQFHNERILRAAFREQDLMETLGASMSPGIEASSGVTSLRDAAERS
jgi:ABC-type multidrug transport system ATPase subunit